MEKEGEEEEEKGEKEEEEEKGEGERSLREISQDTCNQAFDH